MIIMMMMQKQQLAVEIAPESSMPVRGGVPCGMHWCQCSEWRQWRLARKRGGTAVTALHAVRVRQKTKEK
jgi:hypothetical protein